MLVFSWLFYTNAYLSDDAFLAFRVSDNLVRLLRPDDHVTYPWYESPQVDYGIAVDVGRFEADSTGSVTLAADWRITSGNPGVTLYRGESLIQENAIGATTDESVAALSRALARLCDEIALAVRRLNAGLEAVSPGRSPLSR